jgi:hypothetical protein
LSNQLLMAAAIDHFSSFYIVQERVLRCDHFRFRGLDLLHVAHRFTAVGFGFIVFGESGRFCQRSVVNDQWRPLIAAASLILMQACSAEKVNSRFLTGASAR